MKFVSLSSPTKFLRGDRPAHPLFLCLLCLFLHLGDFCFLFRNNLCKQLLALLSRLCVDVELLSLSIGESWEEASFPQCVVYLIHTSRATFAYLRHLRLEFFLGIARIRHSRLILRFGHLCVCTSNFSDGFHRRLRSRSVGHGAVHLHRFFCTYVSYRA